VVRRWRRRRNQWIHDIEPLLRHWYWIVVDFGKRYSSLLSVSLRWLIIQFLYKFPKWWLNVFLSVCFWILTPSSSHLLFAAFWIQIEGHVEEFVEPISQMTCWDIEIRMVGHWGYVPQNCFISISISIYLNINYKY
jgi:hypothetical protein